MNREHWTELGLAEAPACADLYGFVTYSRAEANRVKRALLAGNEPPLNVSRGSKLVGKAEAYRERRGE